MDFDVIPHEDIDGEWKKLGSGSFGNVYKAARRGSGQSEPKHATNIPLDNLLT
ncbi:hypothetical protein FRB95_008663 [Tulasnella sp. JGI-2019a]|nr:hypothetical protein FRB95_008663 [Tulasnella sp. JGI-2019a]